MRRTASLALPCLLLVPMIAASQGGLSDIEKKVSGPQEKPQVITGKLTKDDPLDRLLKKSPHKVHELTLQASQSYQIDLVSKEFGPLLWIEDANKTILALNDGGAGGLNARLQFTPGKGGIYRVIVTASPKGQVTGAYALTITRKQARAEGKGDAKRLSLPGQLTKNDPLDRVTKRPRRVYDMTLMAGHIYQIELVSRDFDPLLRLENAAGWQMDFNDNEAGGLNARLIVEAPKTITLRVIVTGSPDGVAVGAYTLNIDYADPAVRDVLAMNGKVASLVSQSRGKEALTLATRALEKSRKHLGDGDSLFALSLVGLSECYRTMGQYDRTLPLLKQAKMIFKKNSGEYNLGYAITLGNLGGSYQAQGDYAEALPLLQQAKDILHAARTGSSS